MGSLRKPTDGSKSNCIADAETRNSPPTILTSNAPSTPWGCAGSPKQEPAIRNESGASPWPGIRDRHRTPAIGWVWAASSGGMRSSFCAILRNVNPVPLEEPGICAILRTFGAETGRILRRIAQKRPASKRTRSSVRRNRHITLPRLRCVAAVTSSHIPMSRIAPARSTHNPSRCCS